MYFFLSHHYTEPSVLISDPESIREEFFEASEKLSASEALRARLTCAKETLAELSSMVPDSLAGELCERIARAEKEHEQLLCTYEAKKEELKEALLLLGRLKGGRFSP